MLLTGMPCMTGETAGRILSAGLPSKTDKYQFVC